MNTPHLHSDMDAGAASGAGGPAAVHDLSPDGALVRSAATGAQLQPEPIAGFSIGSGLGIDEPIPARARMSSSTALLLGGVLVAGAALVGMRKLGIGPGAAMGRVQFDTKLVDTPPLALGDHTVLLADLNASRVSLQVPDDSVKLNPFLLAHVLPEAGSGLDDSADAIAAARAAADRLKQSAAQRKQALAEALKGLTLNSIVEGATPIARISGRAVRIGDGIANIFTVKSIKGRTVELACENTLYILELNRGGYTTAEPAAPPMSLPPSNTLQPFQQ